MRKCDICDFDLEWGLIQVSGKEDVKTYCPNHLHEYGESIAELKPKQGICKCCGSEKVLTVSCREHSYDLCPEHSLAYISYYLKPKDFKMLYKEDSFDFFLHDDFYEPSSGYAYQPDMDLFERGMKLIHLKKDDE